MSNTTPTTGGGAPNQPRADTAPDALRERVDVLRWLLAVVTMDNCGDDPTLPVLAAEYLSRGRVPAGVPSDKPVYDLVRAVLTPPSAPAASEPSAPIIAPVGERFDDFEGEPSAVPEGEPLTYLDLLPCPFCGCRPYVHTPDFKGDEYQIGCLCGAEENEDGEGAVWRNGSTFAEVVERWNRNRRTPSATRPADPPEYDGGAIRERVIADLRRVIAHGLTEADETVIRTAIQLLGRAAEPREPEHGAVWCGTCHSWYPPDSAHSWGIVSSHQHHGATGKVAND